MRIVDHAISLAMFAVTLYSAASIFSHLTVHCRRLRLLYQNSGGMCTESEKCLHVGDTGAHLHGKPGKWDMCVTRVPLSLTERQGYWMSVVL